MKDIKIDGRTQRVFVLKEAAERLVYIPIKLLHRVDYDRLVELQNNSSPNQMLEVMKKTKLSNGRNALKQYDEIIHVCIFTNEAKTEAAAIPKDGGLPKVAIKKKPVQAELLQKEDGATIPSAPAAEAPKRRGRPPKVNPVE